ncbi:class I SAM-dependent DNA methyltransferase [Burkholderia ubonensis]|uniref:class I SAM-dependent DNA methyltransferase n=1 Tax=Burkholderia ubonensis TaxID=101571 RepID=UPI001E4F74FF|nr:class I SAM-dependent methyltransferase [Burkholderia ubonensis]
MDFQSDISGRVFNIPPDIFASHFWNGAAYTCRLPRSTFEFDRHRGAMTEPLLYGDFARYYDLVHAGFDYAGHADALHALLRAQGVHDGAHLLEAACGTGNYLVALRRHYAVSGFDRSDAMLRVARDKLPDAPLRLADLRGFDWPERVDAILCLCSAIAYLRSRDELAQAVASFARALRPDGVLVLRPWLTPAQAREGALWMDVHDDNALKLCRQAVLRRDNRDAILDFHWLVATAAAGVSHHVDRHVLHLFDDHEIETALSANGFSCRRVDVAGFGQPLWLARRAGRS